MDDQLSRFVAKRSPIHRLDIASAFNNLSHREQIYAHHMSRASWYGTRIVLRQTSPEAVPLFDFIISLHAKCHGEWDQLGKDLNLDRAEVDAFLDYAACFLSNCGNYYGSGDQKFVPNLSKETVTRLTASYLDDYMVEAMTAIPPYNLGFPGKDAQSQYYPGALQLQRQEIAMVSRLMEQKGVHPENTRMCKDFTESGEAVYTLMLASTGDPESSRKEFKDSSIQIRLEGGDHKDELSRICNELRQAASYAANETQKQTLDLYIRSFDTGDLNLYRSALESWVHDLAPKVEHIIGFVEPYRDPYGIRAEFEGLVAIADPSETAVLRRLVEHSDTFIRQLPWATAQTENNGKGPFEKSLFEPPDFASIHALAYCSSIIFPGINLPNYNDIRQTCGFKNVIIANRMSTESSTLLPSPFVADDESAAFQKAKFPAYYIWVVLHELLGHGTGKMMCEQADGSFNFDKESPPIDPLTGKPIVKWYLPGQTWTGQFEDLATTVDECRAELVGAYLMDNKELLELFGYTDETDITAEDLTYNTYMQLAVDGLRGLANFNTSTRTWGQAHSRAHFAMLKCLLRDGNGSISIDFDASSNALTARVDRSRFLRNAKAALGKMLLHLHMYRSTGDAGACRTYYEDLSSVDGEYLLWREAVVAAEQPKWVFVQANTFLAGGQVTLKEYEPTPRGVIQSWAERKV